MRLKYLIKKYLLPAVVTKPLQPFYRLIHRLSLIGMNIGPVGEVATSGEARLARKLMRLAPPKAIIFDVGANRGEFSMVCESCLPPQGRIIAFKPIDRRILILRFCRPGDTSQSLFAAFRN